ncbi:MAG: hypothetical protein HZB26_01065 [Candidatus Hydrogenedentes bacterium]|nr:hypothetical protein [Candidatus Hydrogenedentota bacterium]
MHLFDSLLGTLNVLLHQSLLNIPLGNSESVLYVFFNVILQWLARIGVFTPA